MVIGIVDELKNGWFERDVLVFGENLDGRIGDNRKKNVRISMVSSIGRSKSVNTNERIR